MRLLIISADRTDVHGGACNLGDAFLTDVLISSLQRLGHETIAYDFGPRQRSTSDLPRFRGDRGRDLVLTVARADGVILGGGTMLQDDAPGSLVSGLPRLCATVASVCRLTATPLSFFGVGVDSMTRRVPRWLVSRSVARAHVWVRDEASASRLSQWTRRRVHVGGDACLLQADVTGRVATSRRHGGTVVALNRNDLRGIRTDQWNSVFDAGSDLFLDMDQQAARRDSLSLPSGAAGVPVRPGGHDVRGWSDAYDIIGNAQTVVASRMHALYMAALSGTPMVAVGGSDKVVSFAREFGVPRVDTYLDSESVAPRLVDARQLARARERAETGLLSVLRHLQRGGRDA